MLCTERLGNTFPVGQAITHNCILYSAFLQHTSKQMSSALLLTPAYSVFHHQWNMSCVMHATHLIRTVEQPTDAYKGKNRCMPSSHNSLVHGLNQSVTKSELTLGKIATAA